MGLNRDFSEFIACFIDRDVRFLRDTADIEDLGLGSVDSESESPLPGNQ